MAMSIFNLAKGGCIQYQTTKPTTTGSDIKPTLVFVHYWGGSIRTWRKVIAGLQETYPTVAVNLPGWAGSTLPEGDNIQITIAFQARSVLDLLLSLPVELKGRGFVLVGHSMGAKICMAIAAMAVGEQSISVKGLAFVAPAPPSSLVLPSEMRDQQRTAYNSAESATFTVTNILSSRDLLTDEDVSIAVEDSLGGSKSAKEAWPLYGMGEEIMILKGNGMAVVVVAGENDVVETKQRVLGEVVEKLQERDFRVDFRTIDSGKHLLPLERPHAIVTAITQHF
ncbi:MAG: hypothetical protein M1821_006752 [Bathelium mastoideum]|nr:MAG: hypothetical protein M1821_006752 [Bathelium mastoideum]